MPAFRVTRPTVTQNSLFPPELWPKPSLVLIVPTHRGMARLSWPKWLVIYQVVVVVVVVVEGKFVRHVFIQKYLRRASCSTRTQTASSLGYVWTAPGCSHYECSREDRSKLRVRQCRSCGCRSELSVHQGGMPSQRRSHIPVLTRVDVYCLWYI